MNQHKKEVDRLYDSMNTVMHEAVDISKETDKLVSLLKSLKKRRETIQETLSTLIPEVTKVTHFCSSTALENEVEYVVRGILDQAKNKLLESAENECDKNDDDVMKLLLSSPP
jgi:hypothetical protein